MARTSNLRRQHDMAAALAGEIGDAIAIAGARASAPQAYRIALLLAKLSGTLRIHFAQEDRSLYPMLMASGRGGVAATARAFFDEMGQIGPQFTAYTERWCSSAAIADGWPAFCNETAALFTALKDRIRRENEELYPLADAEEGMHAA